jgi:DNA-directed RNA polymerase specialized sigma24 family protein
MLTIARRAYLDEQRMKKGHFEDLSRDAGLPELQESQAADDGLGDALARALNTLPECHRHAIQLTRINGLSLAETADVLDTTSNTGAFTG